MIQDGVRPPGVVRRRVAPWSPCWGLAIALTLASVVSAGAARTREARCATPRATEPIGSHPTSV